MLAFWLAFILTRPLGASTGDLLSQPANVGGLNLGTVNTSLIFLTVIVSLVTFVTLRQQQQRRTLAAQPTSSAESA